jgi:hypothetical protein
MDEEKRLISDFSHSELQTIGTTVLGNSNWKKKILNCRKEGVIETSCASKHGDLFYNLTTIFCSIKLIEEILLNIVSRKKRLKN